MIRLSPFSFDWLLRLFVLRFCLGIGGGSKSSQQSTTSSSSQINDSRVALADEAAYATGGGTVDKSANDNRTFDDHSVFEIDAQNHSVTDASTTITDARDFSDRSSFTDASVTNVTTSDPETLREMAKGAFSAATNAAVVGSDMLEKVLEFGDKALARSSADVAAARNISAGMTSDVVEKVIQTTKSADQQNTEKLVKAGAILGGAALGTFALVRIFGKAK